MEATLSQNYLVDSYWALLKGLSDNVKLALISKLSSSVFMKTTAKPAKKLMLSDFCNSMASVPFPSADEIREVMQDEDKDINQLCL